MNNEAAMAAAAGSMLLFTVIGLIVGILVIVSEWRLFEKAGEPGWACIVPIYNIIVMLKIGGNPWYWVLLMCIPIVNIIIGIMALQGFLKAYGRGDIGSVLLALFFPVIYFPYLAFSKNVHYVG